ncbi:MAG: APC family permease, partial [Deltaproteobacteria bacterium]|nr:APC family permease [Deltaproteobacteria bacterium]
EYLVQIVPGPPILPLTIAVLAIFSVLAIVGMTESARVALAIFLFHMATLVLFCLVGGYALLADTSVLAANWGKLPGGEGFGIALFFGFSAGLLGISGFESSANFIEEQQPGVFRKTLRNMWLAVTVFNPLIAFLAIGVLPLAQVEAAKDSLLAVTGQQMAGGWLKLLVSVDATLVLCGAVLTSFVGVGGLVRRMALDRCLPQLLLTTNRRGTNHFIFLLFFALCTSIVLLTRGQLFALAGVYTIAFLGVMSLFAIGNILLKVRRSRLQRPVRASWSTVILALLAALSGIVGHSLMEPKNLLYFATYFVPTVAVVGVMFLRIHLLKLVLLIGEGFAERVYQLVSRLRAWVTGKIEDINSQSIIFFTRGDDVANLNRAMLYIRSNELSKRVRVVHLFQDKDNVPERLKPDLEMLDKIYPEIKIDLILRKGEFKPETIDLLSSEYGVPKNYMFIGAPGQGFPHKLSDLGGVRLII